MPKNKDLARAFEHSPLPWRMEFSETGGYDCMTGAWHIRSGRRTVTSIDQASYGQRTCDFEFRSSSAEAEARFIVRACNAHDELLAACKSALDAFERNDAIDWSALEAAIQKGEGL